MDSGSTVMTTPGMGSLAQARRLARDAGRIDRFPATRMD